MAKKGLIKALFAKRNRRKETASKKRYLKHFKEAGTKHAMTYAKWKKEGEQPTYFKGAKFRRKTVEARLREAGISPERFKKKRNK